MGTVFTFDIRPPGVDPAAIEAAVAWLHWVDASFSTYRADSPISRLGCGELDPYGYVKGWAIQAASDILTAAGSISHSVNGGGDVQCVGESAPGQPWRIGIADPHHPGQFVAIVAGRNHAIATSGTAERGHHVLDPHTGRPPHGLASVTVVGPHLADADADATDATDADATDAFAMGTGALAWLQQLPGYRGLVVAADGLSAATSGWAQTQ